MALVRVELFSRALMRTVPITAIVPTDKARFETDPVRPKDKPYKTLYLLNGIYGNNMDWVCASDIFMWATERDLVVIMPAGENRFYYDNKTTGEQYSKFIGEELVEQTRRMFHLSDKREDTYICGLSMGGYGALRNGLVYGDTFSYIAGLSTAGIDYIVGNNKSEDNPDYTQRPSYMRSIFGDLEHLEGSDADIKGCYLARKASGKEIPKMYVAIGTEDFLYESNQKLKKFLEEQGADFVYDEGPGVHDFVFWNAHLKKVLDWLPLEEEIKGISSGNVGDR